MGGRILGVEGGGTKTAWVLTDTNFRLLQSGRALAANLRLTPPERLRAIFATLPHDAQRIGVFLAGCVTAEDRERLAEICVSVWPNAQIITGSDRESGMAAALENRDGIVVNAGTGSSITGRHGEQIEKAGGWGHILGDAGGGYYLSLQALRSILREHDLHRGAPSFSADVLRALSLSNFDELVRWAQSADKLQIAALAPTICAAAERGDPAVQQIFETGSRMLAEYAHAVAGRLNVRAPEVVLLGSLFRQCAAYVSAFRRELGQLLPEATVQVSERQSEFGAAWLALAAINADSLGQSSSAGGAVTEIAEASTEARNPRSEFLDQLSTRAVVELFISEERAVEEALRACVEQLTAATEKIAAALRAGGRLFYVGAGTSGRLGVLDASEIPPTFGAPPEMVQGVIAGGMAALHRSVEGAEDDTAGGALAIEERGVGAADVVCGIAASGQTPFVLSALDRAKRIGATAILLTCNPERRRHAEHWDIEIDLPTGPEIVTGSTRLKAGTATKVALNILSTGAMVALGKVRGNLMINVAGSNAKLRDRAVRIVAELAQCSYEEAGVRLEKSGGDVRAAVNSTRSVTE